MDQVVMLTSIQYNWGTIMYLNLLHTFQPHLKAYVCLSQTWTTRSRLAPAIVPVVAMFSSAKGQLPRCSVPLNQEATRTFQINEILIAANKAAKMDDQ